MQETWDQSLEQEDPLQKGMATHSSILAWRIPWIEESGGPWSHKESDMTERLTFHLNKHLITQLFLLGLWPASCVAQILSPYQATAILNNCH